MNLPIPIPKNAPIEALPKLLSRRAEEDPDRLWLQDVGGHEASYSTALQMATKWSAALTQLDVHAGDRIVTMLPNSVTSVVVWLGIANLGAIEVPVHLSFKGYMLEHTVNTVGAQVLIVDASLADTVAESIPNMPTVRQVVAMDGDSHAPGVVSGGDLLTAAPDIFPIGDLHAWDTAAILFTSGTTGPSKGVVVPWGAVRCTAQRTFPYADLDRDDAIYVFTPSSHMGAKALPYLAAMLGGRAVMRPDFKIASFLDDVRTFGITTTPAIGTIPQFLAQAPPQPDDDQIPLRNVVMAPLVPDLNGFRQRFGVRICTAYSMTELSIPFASDGWNVENHRSVGITLDEWPWLEVRLVDAHDIEVPTGDVGELIVRSGEPWTLNVGYFAMPEATAAAWRNGWFHTGDAFSCDEAGHYYFVDRMKDCIRRRGENISSFEVEAMVNQFAGIAESAAVPVTSEDGNDEVKVFVSWSGDEPFDPSALVGFLVERMPRHMIPRFVETIDELPKTEGTYRVKKQLLRDRGNSPSTWDRDAAGVELPKAR